MFDEIEMEQDIEFDGREAGTCGMLHILKVGWS
jgi:hypothetical protein